MNDGIESPNFVGRETEISPVDQDVCDCCLSVDFKLEVIRVCEDSEVQEIDLSSTSLNGKINGWLTIIYEIQEILEGVDESGPHTKYIVNVPAPYINM